MKIIFNQRQNIFETNSSSVHSFCVADLKDYEIPKEVNFEIQENFSGSLLFFEEKNDYLLMAVTLLKFYSKENIESAENYIKILKKELEDPKLKEEEREQKEKLIIYQKESIEDSKREIERTLKIEEKINEIFTKNNIKNNFFDKNHEARIKLYDIYSIDHVYETFDFLEGITSNEEQFLSFLFSPNSFIHLGWDGENEIPVAYSHWEYFKYN